MAIWLYRSFLLSYLQNYPAPPTAMLYQKPCYCPFLSYIVDVAHAPMLSMLLCCPCLYVVDVPVLSMLICRRCSCAVHAYMSSMLLCRPCSYVVYVPVLPMLICCLCPYAIHALKLSFDTCIISCLRLLGLFFVAVCNVYIACSVLFVAFSGSAHAACLELLVACFVFFEGRCRYSLLEQLCSLCYPVRCLNRIASL